jgi:pimeloyl-ACP methyl ester carboxylesterase
MDSTMIFVYGIHGSLERFYGLIHYLARFGRVVVPDLPGLGGMDTFYRIDKKPTLDNYGDFLAEFIRKELPNGKITLVGMSYGFVVITRMLVRHPELTGRVDLVVSTMGLADGRDIALHGLKRFVAESVFWIARTRPLGTIMQRIIGNPWVLKFMYSSNNPKMKALAPKDRPSFIAFEAYLWECNDMRTYGEDMHELFNLTQSGDRIDLPVHHISTAQDHWLDVAQAHVHIGEIYTQVISHPSVITNHGGTAYADEKEARDMIPPSVARLLDRAV